MRRVVSLLCIGALVACADDSSAPATVAGPRLSVSITQPSSYIIDFTGERLPRTLAEDIRTAGGTLTASLDAIGVAVASSVDPAFSSRASKIANVRGVAPDIVLEFVDPVVAPLEGTVDEPIVTEQSHAVGGHETLRFLQWAPDAVSAPAAWATGALGAGARVAIIDGGIFSAHPDIAPNLDVARSKSFARDTTGALTAFNTDVGTFWHGTHVAGIAGARDNNFGTVGVAPRATLIGVKVVHGRSGAVSWMLQGMVYAATPIAEGGAGANIMNLSLGIDFSKNLHGAAYLKNAVSKAVTYAYQRGVTVIAAAGNRAVDLDHTDNLIFLPAMSTHAIAVSATGPMGWALGSTNLDRPASYTNFGQSAIELAGPGGDAALPGEAPCTVSRPGASVTNPCWVFDMVLAPSRIGWSWAAGTSMASPAVAGVAALIVGNNPGISPSAVRAILRESADDLGKPGNDDFYGRGRVNALRAVQ